MGSHDEPPHSSCPVASGLWAATSVFRDEYYENYDSDSHFEWLIAGVQSAITALESDKSCAVSLERLKMLHIAAMAAKTEHYASTLLADAMDAIATTLAARTAQKDYFYALDQLRKMLKEEKTA